MTENVFKLLSSGKYSISYVTTITIIMMTLSKWKRRRAKRCFKIKSHACYVWMSVCECVCVCAYGGCRYIIVRYNLTFSSVLSV